VKLGFFGHSRPFGAGGRARALVARCAIVLLLLLAFACRHKQKEAVPGVDATPPAALNDSTKDVLLTWIDESGDFHATESVADIKDAYKAHVRVVFTNEERVDPEHVWVADLRQKDAQGGYPIRSMARSAWDEMGASHRKSRIEALSAPAPTADAGPGNDVAAVIYGAEWCKACQETARYLKAKGVKFVEKDVDKSSVVQAELQSKFAKAHVPPTSSIPVTEINGRLIVGFNPQAIDSALSAVPNNSQAL
jgi:glutaredoxin